MTFQLNRCGEPLTQNAKIQATLDGDTGVSPPLTVSLSITECWSDSSGELTIQNP